MLPDFLKRRVGLWAGGGRRSGYAAHWLSPRRVALGAAVLLTLLAFGLSRRSGAIGTAGAPPAGDPGAPPADPAEPAAQPPPAAQGRPHAPAAPPSPQGREGVGDAPRPAGVSPRPVPPAPTPSGTPWADELREGADLAEAIRARLDDDAFADRCPEVWVVLDATLEQLDPLVRDGDRELLAEFLPLARRSIDIAEACR